MRDGFGGGHLAVGDTGDSARDLQHIYGVPSNQSLNSSPGSKGPNSQPDGSPMPKS